MNGFQEPICAGCEFYEDNYKKALDRFLLYKEKIMCTQTLIQKYEGRKEHNRRLFRKLQKSRQHVAAVRERFMHYMEKFMPLEKSYNDLKAAHKELEEEMHTQTTSLVALQQHNKQLTALVEVQQKSVIESRDKSEKIEEELRRKLKSNQLAKLKANEKYRTMVMSAIELADILKEKGLLPHSYKLSLKSWNKQLSPEGKLTTLCHSGGLSPDKASSISSQDTGFDSSKSMSDEESPFDENVMRSKGAAGDKMCRNTSKAATSSISMETTISDKLVNTSDVKKKFSSSHAADILQNLRDIGVNTSISMLTLDLSKILKEVAISDFENLEQSPPGQGVEDHDVKSLSVDTDLKMIDPYCSHQGSIFSPVKSAVHSTVAEMPPTIAEMPPTSIEMPPSNDCLDVYQSKFVKPEKLVFANSDSSKTVPSHLKDTCIAGKSLPVLFASEVPSCGEGQSVHVRDKSEEEERGGGVGGGREEEELEGEEEELGVGEGGEEEECYGDDDDYSNDGANNISSPAHDKGRNLCTGKDDVHNAWNRRMQTALCVKVPSRGDHAAEARVAPILQEMKLFAPRLVSPMSPCNNDQLRKDAAVSASSQMRSIGLGTSDLSFVKCESSQEDFGISQICSNNNSAFQQQPLKASHLKKGKRNSLEKKCITIKTQDLDTEETYPNCKTEMEPLKRVCHNENSSKYSRVLARFSVGKDVSSTHHSDTKDQINNSKNILPDPEYTNSFPNEFMKALNNLASIVGSKKFLKLAKKNNCQRSRRLRKNILKTVRSHKKSFVTSDSSSSSNSCRNIVETASGCFLETVDNTLTSVCSVESTQKYDKFEERCTMTESINWPHEEPNAAFKVPERKNEISQLRYNDDVLAWEKQQKESESSIRLKVSQEVKKQHTQLEKNILQHEPQALINVTQKQVEHNESHVSDILTHNYQIDVGNKSSKSLEKDTDNEVMTSDSSYNCEGTINNSECVPFSTNNSLAELQRNDTQTELRMDYTELLDDLSVSDDASSPESTNANSELSHCVEAEGSNDECANDSAIACNSFSKTNVSQNSINDETKFELLQKTHDDIGREQMSIEQFSSENVEEIPEYRNARYFVSQVVSDNESVFKEMNIPIECSQEICITDQSGDLLDQKCDSGYEIQSENSNCEASDSIPEISTCVSASCSTDGKTKNDTEDSLSHLNNCSRGSSLELTTEDETELEIDPFSPSKNSTDSLAQPKITTDCESQVSVSACTEVCTMGHSDVLQNYNTKTVTQDSEVNIGKDVTKQDSLVSNENADKENDSTDTPDMSNFDSELTKEFAETHKRTKQIINQCGDYTAIKGHTSIKEKLCTNNKGTGICKDVKGTELLTVDLGLQKGAVEKEISNHHTNIIKNEKSEKELEINYPNNLLKENHFSQRLGCSSVVRNCNNQKPLVNCSGLEEPVIKEQQESKKDEIPIKKISHAELDISKHEVAEKVDDSAEAYSENYYTPLRTKKRIAHKPKPQASGSEFSGEHMNFQSPVKATVATTRKQTPKKTKQTTEDEQRNTKTVNTRAKNSPGKQPGHTVNEIGRDLQSLPPTVSMNQTCALETKCSISKVTENVNCVNGARKRVTTEVESDAAPVNSARKRQLKMTKYDDNQLEEPSTDLQAARRSARLRKSQTLKLIKNGFIVHAMKGRRKVKDDKYSTADSSNLMKIDSVKTEKCDDGKRSSDVDNIKEENCDVKTALSAGEPVAAFQNLKVEKLHSVQDDGAVDPLIISPPTSGTKRKIKNETVSELSSKRSTPHLFQKQSCDKTEFQNEAEVPVQASTSEFASPVKCKSEPPSLCLVPQLTDKNKCKEECADGNMSSTSQQHDKGGSVVGTSSGTLEETISNNHTGNSNGEHVYVHNTSASYRKGECISVSYAKGDIIRKCLAIQKRNKFAVRRPTRKMFNQQQVFVSSQLSQLLEGDFTNEILNTVVENVGQDDTPTDAVALVRCSLNILLQEDCNEINRSHDIRAPPLSMVEEKLLTLLITLRNRYPRFSSLISDFLTAVEYYILNLRTTPEYDLLYVLTRFHAALCKAEGLRERAQAFCYDALYSLKRKCFPVIYTILLYYPEVFPKASLGMSSPVCVSIVHSIFTSMNQAINTNLRIKPLITLLCRNYDYKLGEVLSFDLVDCFLKHLKCQSSKSGEVGAAVILLAKRNDKAWTLTQLIPKYLAPIIQEWRCGKINEAVISDVIDLIGCVVKPFSEESDLGPVLKIFKGILHADRVTQTLKMKAALNLARQTSQHFSEVAPTLFEWVPEGGLPDEFWEQMSDILSVKPHNHWTRFLSTCEENNDQMCVGTVKN